MQFEMNPTVTELLKFRPAKAWDSYFSLKNPLICFLLPNILNSKMYKEN